MRLLIQFVYALVFLFLAAFTGSGFYLSNGKVLAERHHPFEPEQAFDYQSGSFADYLAWSVDMLSQARVDAPDGSVIANVAPFRLEPAADCPRLADGRFPKGVLLTHGLIDSPYSMRP